jgi:hypothetical protein
VNARARIHAMFPLGEAATAELDLRLNAFGADIVRKGVNAASIIHHACRRSPASCTGCQVRADILDVWSSVADVVEEKATAEAAPATPDFFQSGHGYTHRDGSDFKCVAVTTHPQTGERLAMGWRVDSWALHYPTAVGINQWNHEYDGVQPPESTQGGTRG